MPQGPTYKELASLVRQQSAIIEKQAHQIRLLQQQVALITILEKQIEHLKAEIQYQSFFDYQSRGTLTLCVENAS
ncbi:MAG: hypothetical protein HRT67_01030 [Flavobacteriaceae bacterium]|nr:hypothetical protein [Flavobacteriaceae bacterium]